MTAKDKLNKAASAHGWANWSEVLLHNAPPHVINLIVEEAMRGEPDLSEALGIIDDYLNAGHKEARTAASEKAKAFYKKHTGKDYVNRIDRECALTWRPGAMVRIKRGIDGFEEGEEFVVKEISWYASWICSNPKNWCVLRESDAVVVG